MPHSNSYRERTLMLYVVCGVVKKKKLLDVRASQGLISNDNSHRHNTKKEDIRAHVAPHSFPSSIFQRKHTGSYPWCWWHLTWSNFGGGNPLWEMEAGLVSCTSFTFWNSVIFRRLRDGRTSPGASGSRQAEPRLCWGNTLRQRCEESLHIGRGGSWEDRLMPEWL